jgi:hypothetical protein
MTFSEYFEQMPEKEKERYLGPGRYEVWKNGNLPLTKFFPPYPERMYSVKELKEMDKKALKREPEKKQKPPVQKKPEKTKEQLHQEHLSTRQKQWMEAYDKRRDAWVAEMKAAGVDDVVAGHLADIYTPEMAKLGKPPKIVLSSHGVQHYNHAKRCLQLHTDMWRNDPETLRHEMTHWWHYGIIKKHPEIQNELAVAARKDLTRIKKMYSNSRRDFMYSRPEARDKAAREMFRVNNYDSLSSSEKRSVHNFFNSVGSVSSGQLGGMHGDSYSTIDSFVENRDYFSRQNTDKKRCNYGEVVSELCERFDDEKDVLRLAFPEVWSIVRKYKGV